MRWLTALKRYVHRRVVILYDEPTRREIQREEWEERKEQMFQEWCRMYHFDPEATESAVVYDEWWEEGGHEE